MATETTTAFPAFPGYLAGTWVTDPTHSEVGFSIRHLMLSKVRGRFGGFEGTLVTTDDPLASSVDATIELSSIDTGNPDRDAHLRSADFFDVDQHQTMSYRSTGLRWDGDDLVLDGDLTLRGVTKQVPLTLEVHGFQPETPFGDSRVGFSAKGEIDRTDFGVSFNMPLEGGGVGLGHKVQINLEVEAIRQD